MVKENDKSNRTLFRPPLLVILIYAGFVVYCQLKLRGEDLPVDGRLNERTPKRTPVTNNGVAKDTHSVIHQSEEIIETADEENKDLTAVVHIGPMRTGSSAIQNMFLPLRHELEADNYKAAAHHHGHDGTKTHRFIRCFRMDEEKFSEHGSFPGDNSCQEDSLENVLEVAKQGHNVILSAEYMSTKPRDVDMLSVYLQPWKNVKIVAFYRRYFDWYVSFHNQGNKHKLPEERSNIVKNLQWRSRSDADMWDEYYIGSIKRMREYFDDVKVINMHSIPDGDVREPFYCDGVPFAYRTCRAMRAIKTVKGESMGDPLQDNAHVPLIYSALAYHAKKRKLWKEKPNKTIEDVAKMLKIRQEIVLRMSEFDFKGRQCPDEYTLNWLLKKSLEAELEMFPDTYLSKGAKEVTEEFERAKKANKFCHIDPEIALEDEALQNFFLSL